MSAVLSEVSRNLVAHAGNDNDYDKYPKDHIKIKVASAAVVVHSFTAISHCKLLLSTFCNIYYVVIIIFAFCPNVLLEFFIKIGYNKNSYIFLRR